MTRSLLRVLIGAFLIFMGAQTIQTCYNEGYGPLYYVLPVIMILAGVAVCIIYYRQHRYEINNPPEDDFDEDEDED